MVPGLGSSEERIDRNGCSKETLLLTLGWKRTEEFHSLRAIPSAVFGTGDALGGAGADVIGAVPKMRWRPWILEVALLIAAAFIAFRVRDLVASERLSDQASLLATAATIGGSLLAAAIAIRAALRHRKRRQTAAMLLPLGLILICGLFVKASVIDTSVEMEALIQADAPATPGASVVLGPGGHDIRLAGEIQEGVARRLAGLLDAHPEVTRIHLTSEGGLADEGQAIGDVIAAHGLTTFVPDYCVSACTLAFVRGRERLALDDARVGFHAPYQEGLFGAMYRGDGQDQRAAYVAAGVAPEFVDAALKVDPAGIWYPTIPELLAAHVITAPAGHFQLPDSSLDGATTLDGARALLLRNFPLLNVLLRHAPDGVDAIAAWYLDAYRRERPEGENTDGLKAIVRGVVVASLLRADDATLLDLARYLDRAVAAATSSPACAAIGGRLDLIVAAGQLEESDADAGRLADALLTRALSGNHRAGKPRLAAEPIAFGQAAEASAKTCADWRQNYRQVLRERPADVVDTMRALIDAQANASFVAIQAVWKPHG